MTRNPEHLDDLRVIAAALVTPLIEAAEQLNARLDRVADVLERLADNLDRVAGAGEAQRN